MFRGMYIFFLVLFLEPQLSNSLVWLNYELNVETITQAFCENKDKPELKCNGKCHLSKQLTGSETSTSGTEEIIYLPLLELFYELPGVNFINIYRVLLPNTLKPTLYFFEPSFKILQPPKG